jgi:type III pantothenate kinase
MRLLLDVGNTRLKWAQLEDGRLGARGAATHRDAAPAEWLAPLDAVAGRPEAILVANVAGPAVAHSIGEWALERHGLRPRFVQATPRAGGVANAYEHADALGVDRWLGLVGAWRRARSPLVCVAAGTALTVDAVDGGGRHLGGLIVPGYALMIEALLRRTSDIAPGMGRAPAAADGMFGRSTAAAVELGALHALAALAARAIDAAAERCGAMPRVFVGGGDAARIAPVLGRTAEIAPDLVLEGLAVVAAEG